MGSFLSKAMECCFAFLNRFSWTPFQGHSVSTESRKEHVWHINSTSLSGQTKRTSTSVKSSVGTLKEYLRKAHGFTDADRIQLMVGTTALEPDAAELGSLECLKDLKGGSEVAVTIVRETHMRVKRHVYDNDEYFISTDTIHLDPSATLVDQQGVILELPSGLASWTQPRPPLAQPRRGEIQKARNKAFLKVFIFTVGRGWGPKPTKRLSDQINDDGPSDGSKGNSPLYIMFEHNTWRPPAFEKTAEEALIDGETAFVIMLGDDV